MCGIVGAISKRNVSDILLEGLKRLEYRGYDSAGMAVLNKGLLERIRRPGKVASMARILLISCVLLLGSVDAQELHRNDAIRVPKRLRKWLA